MRIIYPLFDASFLLLPDTTTSWNALNILYLAPRAEESVHSPSVDLTQNVKDKITFSMHLQPTFGLYYFSCSRPNLARVCGDL